MRKRTSGEGHAQQGRVFAPRQRKLGLGEHNVGVCVALLRDVERGERDLCGLEYAKK
jgi:hypothetical protein